MGNRSSSHSSVVRKAVRYSASGEIESCVFCNIVAGTDPQSTQLIGETENVAAFLPRRRDGARDHILVVPKDHVQNLSSLRAHDLLHLRMLRDMKRFGMECARKRHPGISDESVYRLVFHVPPFNSVDHLHLHVFLPPFDNFWKNFTYTGGWPWCETFDHLWERMGGAKDDNYDGYTNSNGDGGDDRESKSKL